MAHIEAIGRYTIEKELSQGGMSVVYLARDPYMNRRVAIKFLPRRYAVDNAYLVRFKREAQVIAAMEHPAIVPVHDFGEEDGQPYIVMRYMTGGSLADRLKKGPITLAEASRIFIRLSPALDEAHAQGVIHRDLKPGNILFDQRERAYLCDFGLVQFSELTDPPLTSTGGVIGTPAYMSPEQARGLVKLDGRSDVYSLGVIFFEMMSGAWPYRADTPIGLAMMHVLEPVPSLLAVRPDLPPGCDAVIRRAMAKDREDRYRTATAMASAVGRLAQTGRVAAATPPPARPLPPQKPPSFWRRSRAPLWLFGSAVVVVGVMMALVLGDILPSSASTPTLAAPAPTVTTAKLALPAAASATMEPSATPTRTPTLTPTGTLTPTSTLTPTPTATAPAAFVLPTNTSAWRPSPTSTPQPSPTDTPLPADTLPPPTDTPLPPPPTNTPVPPPSDTPLPTNTLLVLPTDTPAPTNTRPF